MAYDLSCPLNHIVIEAPDEDGENGRDELVEMLTRNAQRLPDWISIVATSRPEKDVTAPLQGLNPFALDTATESNRAGIRDEKRKASEAAIAVECVMN